jgi:hypothetical protein
MNGVLVHEPTSILLLMDMRVSIRNTFVPLTTLQIIAGRMAVLTLWRSFWSVFMIMDGKHTDVLSPWLLLICILASMLVLTLLREK